MTKFNSAKSSGTVREIYIPDSIVLTLIMGVICGAWGAVVGLIVGACMDIYYAFTNTNVFKKDEGFW